MSRTFLGALVVLALAACSSGGTPSPSASASSTGEPSASAEATTDPSASPAPTSAVPQDEHPATGLAFVGFPGGSDDPASQIFVVEADGTLRQVTHGTNGTSHPAWSPDRSQIAFGPAKVGSPGIIGGVGVVNADGTEERLLSVGQNPRWSPDGTRLLIQEVDDVTSEPITIWILDVATGEATDLGPGFNPQWLPDGERISFRRMVDTPDGSFADAVFIMTLETGETMEFGTESESDVFWAPDGSAVLIYHDGVLTLAAPDGSAAEPFATGFAPVWSPDSTRILFAHDFDETGTPIFAVMDLDGQTLWSGVAGQTATWSPDGTRIAVEITMPTLVVRVLDAATGETLFEVEGIEPAWTP
jgi:dipeptidyl aminopeptidase/acylaminoacyl peptidase